MILIDASEMPRLNVQLEMQTDESQLALPKPHRPVFVQQLSFGQGVDESHCLFSWRFPKKFFTRDSLFEVVNSSVCPWLFDHFFLIAAVPLLDFELFPALLLMKTLSI